MRCCSRSLLRSPLAALAFLTLCIGPAQAASLTYEITGTLTRLHTYGLSIESHVDAIGFDGGRFRATVTLDDSVADVDPSSTRGLYLGAVTASTLQVESTVFSHNNYCNLELNILDCSVEALNDDPVSPGSAFKADRWNLNSQVYQSAPVPGLPAYFNFMTFNLSVQGLAASGETVNRLDSSAMDFGLERLGVDIPGFFELDLRGFSPDRDDEFGVFWRSTDLRVTRVLSDGEPSPVPEPGSVSLALMALAAFSFRSARRHRVA